MVAPVSACPSRIGWFGHTGLISSGRAGNNLPAAAVRLGPSYDFGMSRDLFPFEGANLGLGCPLLDSLSHRHFTDGVFHVIEMDVSDDMRGPGGAVHGGLLASLIDCAGAAAIAHASQRPPATSNLSVNYLAAGRVGPLRARAESLRIGRHHGVAEVRVDDVGKNDRLVATATVIVNFLDGSDFKKQAPEV